MLKSNEYREIAKQRGVRRRKMIFMLLTEQESLRYEKKIHEVLLLITDVVIFAVDARDKERFDEM